MAYKQTLLSSFSSRVCMHMCVLMMIILLVCTGLPHLLGLSATEMSLTLSKGDLLTAPPGVDPYMVGDRIVLKFGPPNL